MTIQRLAPLAILAALTLSGCEKEDATPASATLLGQRWMLQQIDNTPLALSSYSETSRSYLEFIDLGHCTVGLGPCNNFSGRFTLGSGQQLSISPQITTRMACPALDYETRYLAALARTTRYETSGGELRLYDAEVSTPRLIFRQGTR